VEVTFSPDGQWLAWVRHDTLHVVRSAGGTPFAPAGAPAAGRMYGRLDWVYQEEIYGRGHFRGYWWSPDSKRLAMIRLDTSAVADTVLEDAGTTLRYRYPRAGTPNPVAALGIIDLRTPAGVRWIETDPDASGDVLLVNVAWSPDGRQLSFQVQDREQTWLELKLVDPADLETRTALRETSSAWVQVLGPPRWLDDGSFLWLSERTGRSHIYQYNADAGDVHTVTAGDWDVRKLHHMDTDAEGQVWVYFSSTERSSVSLHACRTRIDGSGRERLTAEEGTHDCVFSPDGRHFIDRHCSSDTPPEVRISGADGTVIQIVEPRSGLDLDRFARGATEFFQITARDGFVLEAMMTKPADFDPNRKYPVLCYVYGGPMTPVVRNRWGGATALWHQMIASRGAIVWSVDNRSSSAKGVASSWPVYRRFGEVELEDLTDSVEWLKGQRYIDADRFALWGWSFGGYLTSYAMTHSRLFRAGIAGAPVTDWALYDTIYTERYMQTPGRNPEGYRRSSVLEAAGDLHGKLLIVHGTMDDNVHLEHSMRLVRELQRAGRDFELMVYPGAKHRVEDPAQIYDLRRRMTAFVLENL
jgi:dipeptidyl-peptidase-4